MKKITVTLAGIATIGAGGVVVADNQINPYDDKGTHYELPITSDIPQGEKVLIAKDRAAMTLTGWSGEYAITIEPQIPTDPLLLGAAADKPFIVTGDRPLLSKKMEYTVGNTTAFIEPVASTTDQFDIDFTLNAKPPTNVFTYKITGAEDFDFFYQPPLTIADDPEIASCSADGTQCFDKDGNVVDERPDNVVGSYAVYSKTKANHRVGSTNYATGKVAHIYRPKATDANGDWTWATLSYASGVLSVEVPQDFLDKATYPVRVDPTFGYTSIGGSGAASSARQEQKKTLGESGNVTSISYASDRVSAGTVNFSLSIYDDSAGSANNLLADSGASVATWTFSEGSSFKTLSVSASSLSAADYHLGFWPDISASYYYDVSTDTKNNANTAGTWHTWPSTFGAVTGVSNRTISIYATYTATGASPANYIQVIES